VIDSQAAAKQRTSGHQRSYEIRRKACCPTHQLLMPAHVAMTHIIAAGPSVRQTAPLCFADVSR